VFKKLLIFIFLVGGFSLQGITGQELGNLIQNSSLTNGQKNSLIQKYDNFCDSLFKPIAERSVFKLFLNDLILNPIKLFAIPVIYYGIKYLYNSYSKGSDQLNRVINSIDIDTQNKDELSALYEVDPLSEDGRLDIHKRYLTNIVASYLDDTKLELTENSAKNLCENLYYKDQIESIKFNFNSYKLSIILFFCFCAAYIYSIHKMTIEQYNNSTMFRQLDDKRSCFSNLLKHKATYEELMKFKF